MAEPLRHIAVLTHHLAKTTDRTLRELADEGRRLGLDLVVPADEAAKHRLSDDQGYRVVADDELRSVDLCLVLGGDGTILRALGRMLGSGVPTTGVNFGNVGFLAGMRQVDWRAGLERISAGSYTIIDLLTVEARWNGERHRAVNDIVLARVRSQRVVRLVYEVSGTRVGEMLCDGMIVASPAGSTAYNLSCDGPLVVWDADALVLNFIAPHSLGFRPLVLRPDHVIRVRNASPVDEAEVLADGSEVGPPVLRRDHRDHRRRDPRPSAGERGRLVLPQRRREALQPRAPCLLSAGAPAGAPMLAELSIADLVLIAGARLELAPGLNVITGETGAGKTLLTQGIGLLLGQKGEESLVRPGAEQALVQAVFDDDGETLSVARRITRGGRSRAFLDGLVSSLPAVEAVLRERVAFYGQLEHARLLQLDRQLDLLDAWAGAGVAALLDDYVAAWSEAQELSRELLALRGAGRDRERELELLRFQIDEIEAAAVEPGEDELLKAERERLRHSEKLVERVGGAIALFSDESSGGGLDALRTAERLLAEAETLDPALAAAAARLAGLSAEADDLLGVLRAYLDDLDVDPAHRDAVELRYDRLSLLDTQVRRLGRRRHRPRRRGERAAGRARTARSRRVRPCGPARASAGSSRGACRAPLRGARRSRPRLCRRSGRRAARAGHAARALRGRFAATRRGSRRPGPAWRRRGRVRLLGQPRSAAAPAARNRLGRRALARHARHQEPRAPGPRRAAR